MTSSPIGTAEDTPPREIHVPDEVGALRYDVIHVVVGESMKDLIESQVVDHMECQARVNGVNSPSSVTVLMLEPARVALRATARRRLRHLRARAPHVRVMLLPYVSRLGIVRNARILGPVLRRRLGSSTAVFHCRAESAVEWARGLRQAWRRSGIVFDVRGAQAEEVVFARGFDGTAGADAETRQLYDRHIELLRDSLRTAGSVLCVSSSMQQWLVDAGARPERVRRVPCCVTGVAYSPDVRARMREELGLEHKLVLAYVGTITRYQHVEDGLLPFFATAFAGAADVHLLALTSDDLRMTSLLNALPVPKSSWTVTRVPQSRVPEYLCAADAGVLLREATRMNRVSMPVKFGEYLSCGVPVIASRVGGWIDELVERSGAGVVVDWFGTDEQRRTLQVQRVCERLRADGERMRGAALALCERDFLWSRYVDDVRAAYTESLESHPHISRDH